MIVIIFPLIIIGLSFAILFNMHNPSQTAYIVVGIVNISMLSFMFFGTKFYKDNAQKRAEIEFKQEVQSQIQSLKKRLDILNDEQLQFEIDKINDFIAKFTLHDDEIETELLSKEDFR
jgi:hypothetical protein